MPRPRRSPDICGSSRARAGQQPHGAALEPRLHAVAVELDFVQPLGPVWRRVDEPGELRLDPIRRSGPGGAPPRYGPRHAGRGERLRCQRMCLGILAYPSATARRAQMVSAAS